MNNQQQDTNTNDQAFEEFLVQLEAHEAKLNEERAEDLLVRWDAGDRDFTSVELNILTQYLTHRNAAFEADAERLEAEIQRSKDQVTHLPHVSL